MGGSPLSGRRPNRGVPANKATSVWPAASPVQQLKPGKADRLSPLWKAGPALALGAGGVQPSPSGIHPDPSGAVIQQAAQAGLQSPASPLPFAAPIRRSFGRHDVSSIRAHTGPEATAGAAAMNAVAYATGDHLVFARPPDLRTVAHEAAHVVQQRGGVRPPGGVGRVGDPYEVHADAVAALVVAGRSAQALLDRFGPAGRPAAPQRAPVQRMIGFEIEAINLPATDPGAGDVAAVTNLLTQDLGYAHDVPSGHASWKRETDHGGVGKIIEKQRLILANKATVNQADLQNKPASGVAHLEYITEPFAETEKATYDPGWWARRAGYRTVYGTNQMAATIGEIANDITNLTASVDGGTLTGNSRVGIPPATAWDNAAVHYGMTQLDAQTARAKIVNAAAQAKLYVQATMGVLPEKIINFMRAAANPAKAVNPVPVSAADRRAVSRNRGLARAAGGVGRAQRNADFMQLSRVMMQRVLPAANTVVSGQTGLAGPLYTTEMPERAALAGLLTLVLQTSLASVIWEVPATRYGGTSKNFLSFLPKSQLHTLAKSLPTSVRPDRLHRRNPVQWQNFVQAVYQKHLNIGADLTAVDGRITPAIVSGAAGAHTILKTTPKQWMEEVLSGQQDQSAVRNLPLESAWRGGRSGIATGRWLSDTTTRAIPLETRHYEKILAPNDLQGYAGDMKDLLIRAHK